MVRLIGALILICTTLYSSSVSAEDDNSLYKWLRDAKPSAWILAQLYLDSLAQLRVKSPLLSLPRLSSEDSPRSASVLLSSKGSSPGSLRVSLFYTAVKERDATADNCLRAMKQWKAEWGFFDEESETKIARNFAYVLATVVASSERIPESLEQEVAAMLKFYVSLQVSEPLSRLHFVECSAIPGDQVKVRRVPRP